jgi:hypothetical protein
MVANSAPNAGKPPMIDAPVTVPVDTTPPAAPITGTIRPKIGTHDVVFVGFGQNETMIRLYADGVMQNEYGRPCSYLPAEPGIIAKFRQIPTGSRVQVTLLDSHVSAVRATIITPAVHEGIKRSSAVEGTVPARARKDDTATEAKQAASKARRNAMRGKKVA